MYMYICEPPKQKPNSLKISILNSKEDKGGKNLYHTTKLHFQNYTGHEDTHLTMSLQFYSYLQLVLLYDL